MGIFSSIKNAIFGETEEREEDAPHIAPTAQPAQTTQSQPGPRSEAPEAAGVEARHDSLSQTADIYWRGSIVDLFKLVRIDSSDEKRKEPAPESRDADHPPRAQNDIRPRRQTMKALAGNDGETPAELID